ncbi:serine/threonine-protein kinase [Lentzea flaviverrucosa]|uniref:non-specific serine/threonine protein kinase n=1 Tax=Lentzea flaviverrucosa TaxID=200379 RepID=A0A1H9XTH5_9PSEU|nr:serine/threonine-protein kinase [Lentzea flaviverrucosa]RDI19195.1 protein kinase-like protein [Lentzea flaviverrucosa]SES49426.1 Protein kinase domain-containing protein [Lentzea flaviverrucosa]
MREVGNRRYRLVRELGRGGMGVVWLGEDTVLGRDVAVKELLLPGTVPAGERAVYQERVLREARIASRLQDPAVVTVYDLISEDDQTFIVMELINAPTLEESVDLDGPLGTREAATLARQLLGALEAAHSSGVVHRDVKPGNVMVPGRGTAKLTDFGIAQSVDDPRLTATGTLIGCPPTCRRNDWRAARPRPPGTSGRSERRCSSPWRDAARSTARPPRRRSSR